MFSCGRKLAAVAFAWVVTGGFVGELSARVLPCLAFVVPMETKLRENHRYFAWLLLFELNPNPLSDYLGNLPKGRCFTLQDFQDFVGG